MKKVFTAENRLLVWNAHNYLEAEGIPCTIKNDEISSIMGEVPSILCWAELWVNNDLHYQWAVELLAGLAEADELECPNWECSSCRERIGGEYGVCWNCGKLKINN